MVLEVKKSGNKPFSCVFKVEGYHIQTTYAKNRKKALEKFRAECFERIPDLRVITPLLVERAQGVLSDEQKEKLVDLETLTGLEKAFRRKWAL